jgi:hypothetical protein
MFWLRLIYTRLYGLLRKDRVEREMEDEARFHLLMRTRENIERGMRPDEFDAAYNIARCYALLWEKDNAIGAPIFLITFG